MSPCLTLSIIRYGSRVKWSNPGKGVVPSPTPWCSSYRKGSLRVTLDYGRQLYFTYGCDSNFFFTSSKRIFGFFLTEVSQCKKIFWKALLCTCFFRKITFVIESETVTNLRTIVYCSKKFYGNLFWKIVFIQNFDSFHDLVVKRNCVFYRFKNDLCNFGKNCLINFKKCFFFFFWRSSG